MLLILHNLSGQDNQQLGLLYSIDSQYTKFISFSLKNRLCSWILFFLIAYNSQIKIPLYISFVKPYYNFIHRTPTHSPKQKKMSILRRSFQYSFPRLLKLKLHFLMDPKLMIKGGTSFSKQPIDRPLVDPVKVINRDCRVVLA